MFRVFFRNPGWKRLIDDAPFPVMLHAKALTLRRDGFLLNVDRFDVQAGEIVVLCGHNGSGKSTLCALLAGQLEPDSGLISVCGSPAVAVRRAAVAYLPARPPLFEGLSVVENVVCESEPITRWLGLKFIDWKRAATETEELLATLGQGGIASIRCVSNLSTGQRAAVAIARALRLKRSFLFLDEADGRLGLVEVELLYAILKTVAARGVGVVLVSHRPLDSFTRADRVVLLRGGSVAARFERGAIPEDWMDLWRP